MRKKITFLLALTAAVLLALPSQAQNNQLRNSAKPKVQKFESPRAKFMSKDAILKAQDQATGIAFRGKVANVLTKDAFLLAQAEKDAELKKAETFKWQNSARFVSTSGLVNEGLASQPRKAAKDVDPDPYKATVILTAGDVWGDGTGYQMLLDADANAYGTIIPETGGLTTSGDADALVYEEFEYKIPENADGSLTTENIVLNNSISITIPEGTYDWCITNPTPGDRVWISSSNGSIPGRYDNYLFEKGHVYEFTVTPHGSNDGVTLLIDGELPPEPPVPVAEPVDVPYTADFTSEAPMDNFSILDANNDGSTWSWSSSNYANYKWNSSNAADDYLILPVNLEADKSYDVTVNAAANSSTWAERFEVVYGTEPTAAAMTNTIIGATDLTTTTFADYSGSFSVAAAGTYYVAIHAISDADKYYLKVQTFSIEVGAEGNAPAAVDNFAVTPFSDGNIGATITFDAPTTALDGTDLSAGDITKIEILRDGEVIETINTPAPGSNQSYSDTGMNAGIYNYQVITYGASGIGGKSEILSVFLSGVLSVPYTQDMTQNVIDLFQVIDANEDNTTWKWSEDYGTNYSYNYSNAADDYLISMPIALETGKSYVVAVTARAYNASYPEQFEVLIGKEATVAGLTQTVIASTDVTSTEDEEFEGEFSVAEDGNYYVAIHATSAANMWRLIVSQLSVVMGADPAAPAAIELTAEPGAQGAAEVNLSFTAPANAINGSALSGNLDIKIYRDDALVETLTGVAPGSAQTWTDTDVATHQTYTYYVVAANASGDGQKSNKVSVYVGPDDLANVTGVEITAETASTLTFAWDQVQGLNGGYIDLENIEYSVWTLDSNTGAAVDKLGSTIGETEITVDYDVDEGEQDFAYFGVSASDGTVETNPSASGAYTWALVGAPYDLPILESFQDQTLHYVWDFEGGAYITSESSDDDGVALALLTTSNPMTVGIVSGKMNLKNTVNPTLLFDAKRFGSVASFEVLAAADGGAFTSLGTFALTDEYQSISVPLTSVKDATRYSQFAIMADVVNPTVSAVGDGDALVIDNFAVRDILDYDLSMAVNAPASVVAGKKATITATVTNQGQNAIGGFTVTIKAGEEELLNQTVDLELESFETSEFTADFDTDVFTEAGDVTITAEVTYENDGNEANNIATTTITVKEPTAAQPTDVTATQTDEGVVVSWTAPDPGSATTEATQDFEASDMGEFTTIDADGDGFDWVLGSACGGIYLVDGASLAGTGHNASADLMTSGSYRNITGGGGQALTPDNWLVTPQAVLNGTFSFWACGQDASYAAEHFGVFVSTAGNSDPADFTLVQEWTMSAAPAFEGPSTPTRAQGNWYEYSVDLSSYAGQAGYVAIRHFNCTDMFLLNVDDINYLTGGGAGPESYNVYVDGELVATVTDGTETTITGVEDGDHTVAVTAVYPDGSESRPVEVTLTTTGMGQIVINTNKPVDVYSLDGKLIRKQTVSLAGLKGAYIVNGHKVVLK